MGVITRAFLFCCFFWIAPPLFGIEYELIQYNQPADGVISDLKSMGDLVGNGREDLVGVRERDGFNSDLVFLEIGENGEMEVLWSFPLPRNYLGEWVDFTISDLDHNGRPEIVAISNIVSSSGRLSEPVNWLFVFEWNGEKFPDRPTTAWGYQDTEGIFPRPNQIIPGDPDGDGLTEFVISFTSPVPRVMILEFSGDFSTPGWTIEYYGLPDILASGLKPFAIGVADITGDNRDDVSIFQRRDTDMVVIRITSTKEDKYQVSNITTIPLEFAREIVQPQALAFADLTGNGRREALIGTNSGKIYLAQFSDISRATLPHPRLSLWQKFTSAVNALDILDYNADNREEIVAQTEENLFLLEQIRQGDEHFANFISLLSEPVGHVTAALPFLGGVLYTTDEDGLRTVTQFIPKGVPRKKISTDAGSISLETPQDEEADELISPEPTGKDSLTKDSSRPGTAIPPVTPPKVILIHPDLVITVGEQFEYIIPMGDDIDPANMQIRFLEYPVGMKIGRDFTLRWNTTPRDLGFHKIHYLFTDKVDTTLWLYVNAVPQITSLAPEYVEVGHQFLYRVEAEDENPDAILNFALVDSLGGMTIDSTGLIQWQPAITQLDTQWVDVKVTDGFAVNHQRFPVYVNSSPEILGQPSAIAYLEEDYAGQIVFQDANHPNTARAEPLSVPAGMDIASSGEIKWTPQTGDIGFHDVIYQITDDYISIVDSFAIFVNAPPRIVSTFPKQAQTGVVWNYRVKVDDPNENQLITYLIPQSTSLGVSINRGGDVTWTPTAADVDSQQFQISVSDGMRDDIQTVRVFVNDTPRFTTLPDSQAIVGQKYSAHLQASDQNKTQTLKYSLVTAPTGMAISPGGEVSWLPGLDKVDEQRVKVKVSDGLATVVKSFSIFVNDPPQIISKPELLATTDSLYQYQVETQDANHSQTMIFTLGDAPAGATISSGGLLEWTPAMDEVGNQKMIVSVSDGIATTSQSIDLFVNAPPQILSKAKLVALTNFEYRYKVDATDANNDAITFRVLQMPEGAQLDENTGLIVWIPTREQEGVNDFSIEAIDVRGGVAKHPFQVHVFVDPKRPVSWLLISGLTLTGIGLIGAILLLR